MVVVNRMNRGQTAVPNDFIDHYLLEANGEYVKVYIMLLRLIDKDTLSISNLADSLDITEKDVQRALVYWEKQGLVELETKDGVIESLIVKDFPTCEQKVQVKQEKKEPKKTLAKDDKEFAQLIYVVEQFLSRTLSRTDASLITWLYEEQHFSVELIEYLAEYCASVGKKKTNYIKAVAEGWIEQGIKTPEQAKSQVESFAETKKKGVKASGNKFHNFDQRQDDLEALISEEMKNGA